MNQQKEETENADGGRNYLREFGVSAGGKWRGK